ncbi:MAG: GTPase ObgE [Bacteroidia bacterium]|nr:GTPase ObgE [Bacteroidia bacterium]
MAESNFVDYVKIYFTSGKGGAGAVSFRREKFIAKGGPDGGNGGNGGSIYLRGNPHCWTLLDLKYRKFIKAEAGQNGSGRLCTGKDGADIYLDVPLGTVLKNAETGEFLGEIQEENQTLLVVKGGRGGKGNAFFKSPTLQTPDFAQPGEPGTEFVAILELKMLADVGLVGFPNAGKSTLLSVLTAAKPEIADYPFTTLVPNLGIVKYKDYQSFAIADIPGIIEGASEGRGLGLNFLRHIERNAALLYLVPCTSDDILQEYQILRTEIGNYNPELLEKKSLLVITKADLLDEELVTEVTRPLKEQSIPFLVISSATQYNIEELKDACWQLINETNWYGYSLDT